MSKTFNKLIKDTRKMQVLGRRRKRGATYQSRLSLSEILK